MARNIHDPNENFYIILGVHYNNLYPDKNEMKKIIDKKVKEWAENINNPSKKLFYAKWLGFADEMKRVMALQTEDTKEVPELEKLRVEESQAARETYHRFADDFISKSAEKGEITEQKIGYLQSFFPSPESKNIIDRVLRGSLPSGIKIVKENGTCSKIDTIDALTKKKLETNLRIIGIKTLYEFLGIQPDASEKEMSDIATKKYNEYSKKEKTPENIAAAWLAGFARTLSKPEKRVRYDNYLKEIM